MLSKAMHSALVCTLFGPDVLLLDWAASHAYQAALMFLLSVHCLEHHTALHLSLLPHHTSAHSLCRCTCTLNYLADSLLAAPQNGLLFGLPIVLDTNSEDIKVGDKVLLKYQGQDLAAVTIESKWVPNKPLECVKAYGTSSLEHPAVQMVGSWGAAGVRVEDAHVTLGCRALVDR